MKYLRSMRGFATVGAIAAVVGVTMWVVLPALASNPGDKVLPPSTYPTFSGSLATTLPGSLYNGMSPAYATGVTPIDRPVGGNGSCADPALFPTIMSTFTAAREYDNPNPTSSTGYVASGSGDGAQFQSIVSGSNKSQVLEVDARSAAILGIAVNGGNDTTAYDYTGLQFGVGVPQGWTPADGNLHAPASKFTVSGTTETVQQSYGVSHLTVCYLPLATISGRAYAQGGSGNTPLSGMLVTVYDTTTGKTVAQQTVSTSDSNGNRLGSTTNQNGDYAVSVPVGDSYKVCVQSRTGYTETSPSGPPSPQCSPPGQAPYGRTVSSLTSSGQSGQDFVFTQQITISGQVYNDLNLNGKFDHLSGSNCVDSSNNAVPTPCDTTVGTGWTVGLYHTTSGSSTFVASGGTTGSGTYSFTASVIPTDSYKLCVTPPVATKLVQTEPRPTSSSPTCDDVTSALQWGFGFTGGTSDVSQNFGSAAGFDCSSANAFGSGGVLALMPGSGSGCLKDNTFAFANGVDPSNDGKQYVGVAVGDPTDTTQFAPVVEKITFTDPLQDNGTPQYTGLEYIAGSVTSVHPMQSCNIASTALLDAGNSTDYGAGAPTDMRLNQTYAQLLGTETPNPPLPSGETACLISIDITGASGGSGTLTAYVYTTADSQAFPR
jgi:hypothetical protein